jgi:hypothetical protein
MVGGGGTDSDCVSVSRKGGTRSAGEAGVRTLTLYHVEGFDRLMLYLVQ